jgi:hypothetical protein
VERKGQKDEGKEKGKFIIDHKKTCGYLLTINFFNLLIGD